MPDLLVITPTRGRPGNARGLVEAFRATGATADLMFAVDDDDPELAGYRQLEQEHTPGVRFTYGPRRNFVEWTNRVAVASAGAYRAVASIGDDHRPRTARWDAELVGALDGTGGTGLSYGDDWLQGERVPTSVVISSDIVAALGWMCLPSLKHYYADDVWKHLGQAGGCLYYLPKVVIEHEHPLATGIAPDRTYREAQASYLDDRAAFRAWLGNGAAADVEKVRRLVPERVQ